MGPDNVPTCLLKLALSYVVEPLAYMYNLCIQKSVFPKMFKTVKLIPPPKTPDRSDPNNFRPVYLLCVLSKPLERHVHKHLPNLFGETQPVSYPSKHSCHTALSAVYGMWLSAIDRSEIA